MLKNLIKTSIRSFRKDKLNALINLGSLAVGLACVFMIMAYISYEFSYDKSYSHHDRVYRVIAKSINKEGVVRKGFSMPDELVYTLKDEYPDVESVSGLGRDKQDILVDGRLQKLDAIGVDTSFFHLFDFSFLEGNANSIRNDRDMVLTASAARRLFPGMDPVGRTVYTGRKNGFRIVGIIKDIPLNTHIKTEAMFVFSKEREKWRWEAYSTFGTKYILLKPGVNGAAFEKKLAPFYAKYHFPQGTTLEFQPVTSIHLYSTVEDDPFANGSIRNIYIFAIIAVLILLIGCINYINLTTARSFQRLREVGVRKVLGASKARLILQFITESVLFFIISLPVALLLAALLWRPFIRLLDIEADTLYLLNIRFIMAAVLISIVTGIISGLYPSLLVARLHPVYILKGWQKKFKISLDIRKPLIVFQFVVSVVLIIATLVVYSQLHLLNNTELGFNKENLVVLPYDEYKGAGAFKDQLKEDKDIKNVSLVTWEVGKHYGSTTTSTSTLDSNKIWEFAFAGGDFDMIKTLESKIVKGRDFSSAYSTDIADIDSLAWHNPNVKTGSDEFHRLLASRSIIVTQKTVDNLGLKEPVIGQSVDKGGLQGTIIGIVKDFNGTSLLKKQSMVVLQASPVQKRGYTYIRIDGRNTAQTLAYIEKTWKQFFPNKSFEFSFADEKIQQLYSSQQRLASIFNSFAILAILIAVIGLFSLLAISVRQRAKEISIRKVLGANVSQIVQLLSTGFVKLIALAIVIASPLAWWLMSKWVQDFELRTTIHWWIFAVAGSFVVIIALSVIVLQAIRVAVANPVVNLRTE
ncbi:MAG TPA: ABC transporter permease [Puia sp.]|nr:ABC transporter permease [Puia sp.]